jgi:pilus assembly protein CpaB
MKVSPGTLILGIFAILFGLMGAYYAKYHLRQEEAVAQPRPDQPRIVPRASTDIAAGRTVTMGDIMLVSMTREQLKKENFPSPYMVEPSQIIGRTLREPLPKGAVFQLTDLYPEGLGPSVAERLQPGYRAITVPLTNSASELAMVTPGMNVDIVFRTEPDSKATVPETTVTLLERVEVLAIGQETFVGVKNASMRDSRSRSDLTVTLAVTPEQASALKVVEGHGTMSLVIRGELDESLAGNVGPRNLAALLELSPPAEPTTTQIYRRGHLTTMVFEGDTPQAIASDIQGLPIAAADGRRPTIHSVSQSTVSTSPQGDSKDCGCGSKTK